MRMPLRHVALLFALTSLVLTAKTYAADTNSLTTKAHSERSNLIKTDDFGVGIKWGTITGFSGKYWANENAAWEGTVAFADSNTAVGLDYLWHFRGAMAEMGHFDGADNFVPFVGAGLLSSFGGSASNTRIMNHDTDSFDLAARIPLGIEYMPSSVHLGVFGEIGLGLGFVPTSYSFATADVGARYYF